MIKFQIILQKGDFNATFLKFNKATTKNIWKNMYDMKHITLHSTFEKMKWKIYKTVTLCAKNMRIWRIWTTRNLVELNQFSSPCFV